MTDIKILFVEDKDSDIDSMKTTLVRFNEEKTANVSIDIAHNKQTTIKAIIFLLSFISYPLFNILLLYQEKRVFYKFLKKGKKKKKDYSFFNLLYCSE